MYKIGRFEIENFKSISKKLSLNFSEVDTVIFDGPNGFGKTTLFDAIELCFTGKISRFESATGSSDQKAKNSHILKYDNSKSTTIILELINTTDKTILVIKAYISPDIKGVKASVRDYHLCISRAYKRSWEADDQWLELTQNNLGDLIGLKSIESLFHIQHYIQQEETAGFLKNNNEGNRHKQLSHLFGTEKQTTEFEKIEKLRKALDSAFKKTTFELTELKKLASSFITPNHTTAEKNTNSLPSGKCPLLLQPNISTIDTDKITFLKTSLDTVRHIADAPGIYTTLSSNNTVDTLLLDRDQQLNDLIRLGSADSFSEIQKLYRTQNKWLTLSTRVNAARMLISLHQDDNNAISENFIEKITSHYPPDNATLERVQELQSARLQNKGLSLALNQINSSRSSLIEAYKALNQKEPESEVFCPLCGDVKKSGLSELISDVDNHYLLLMSQASNSTQRIAEILEKIIPEYILKTINRCQHIVDKYSKYCTNSQKAFFEQKLINEDRFEKFKKVQLWLKDKNIDISTLVDNGIYKFRADYSTQLALLKSSINQTKTPISEELPKFQEIIAAAKSLEMDKAVLMTITKDDITSDYNYLTQIDLHNKSALIKSNLDLQNTLSIRLSKISDRKTDISEVSAIYKREIQSYESIVAAKIAIPFYVYSSKVLQTRPEGTGIFLKTLDTGSKGSIPYIRFCSERNDDHDAWYTMSSGQLSGLIISFALAMNKLYPSKLKCVLIDDPMQSMDEINMASLTQLLRYEFSEHQFILSTHDTNISSYMNYKFNRSGKIVDRINLKNIAMTFN